MRMVVEETRCRKNFLLDHGCYRDEKTGWGYRGVYYGSFLSMWKRFMQLLGKPEDWNPPFFYWDFDCDKCKRSSMLEMREIIKRTLRSTINRNCTCGGRGPEDPECCPACKVWHELYTEVKGDEKKP